jgi:hypothetical protein
MAFMLIAAAAMFSGCRENTIINSKVSPSNNADSVYALTLSCITHTYYDDSVITSTNIGAPIYEAVGGMVDPYFGTMTGATYFQVIPSTFDTSIYTGETIDSAVLVLPYSGFTYGSTATDSMATYQVFYMADSIGFYNNYYAFSTKAIDANFPLSAPATLNIAHLDDSILVTGINHSGLRIKLNLPVVMNHIIPALTAVSATGNAQDFINLFNGICVRTADSRVFHSAMPYFELDGTDAYSEAGILVYYHPTGTAVDSDNIEAYYFNTGICAHFNNVTKSYAHYPINNLLHSTQANDNVIALQNQPGASIDIVIPGIKSIPNGIISKAEIQFSLLPAYTDTALFMYPERISPLGVASATYHPLGTTYSGELYSVYDVYPTGYTSPLTVLDGYMHVLPYLGASPSTNTFTIDIPREVLASMSAKNDTLHYHINGTQDYYGAFHMVAGGGTYGIGTPDSIYKAKVIIVYSKLTH